MANRKITAFPMLGVNTGATNVMQAIAAFIQAVFPPNFFKFVHVDTKTGLRDFYKQLYQNRENPHKIKRPSLIVLYNMNNFSTDESGLGVAPMRQYPAQYIDTSMAGYELFYKDNFDVRLYTSDIRVKVQFEVRLEFSSRSDQLSANAYLMNFIRFHYGYRLTGIKTHFLLPNYMISLIRNLLYRTTSDSPITPDIVTAFDAHLKQYSANGIEPLYFNGNKDKKFYKLNREYNSVYLQTSGAPELGEGDKKGDIYEKFTITFPGFLEFYIPVSCIFNSPELVAGSMISSAVFTSLTPDEKQNVGAVTLLSSFNDHVSRPLIDTRSEERIHYEEFLIENPEDEIDILSWLSESEKELIAKLKPEEIQKLYRVILYENQYILDEGFYRFTDNNLKIKIKDGNVASTYTVEVYRNISYYEMLQYRRNS